MPVNAILEDTTLAALVSSKICHDLAGQITAINNGLELLEEETDDDARYYALELIQSSAKLAWVQLEFLRLAFGASSSLGTSVPLGQVEQVARRYVENGKRKLHWQLEGEDVPKEYARVLLAALALALTAVPSGGDFYVGFASKKAPGKQGTRGFHLIILCRGRNARIPERSADILAGKGAGDIDNRSVLPYYAARLASEAGLALSVSKDGEDILFQLRKAA